MGISLCGVQPPSPPPAPRFMIATAKTTPSATVWSLTGTEAAGCCFQPPAFYQVRRPVWHRTAQVLRIRGKIFSGSATRHRAEQHRRQSTAGSHCPSLWSGVQDCWARIATLGMRSGWRPVAPCIPDHQMAQPPSAPRGRLRCLCNWSICELSLCLADGPLGFPVHLGRRDHRFGAGTVTGLGAAATLGFSWTSSVRTQSVETSTFSKRVSPSLLALFVPSVRPYLLPQPIYSPCCSRLLCSVDLFSSPFRSQPAPVF